MVLLKLNKIAILFLILTFLTFSSNLLASTKPYNKKTDSVVSEDQEEGFDSLERSGKEIDDSIIQQLQQLKQSLAQSSKAAHEIKVVAADNNSSIGIINNSTFIGLQLLLQLFDINEPPQITKIVELNNIPIQARYFQQRKDGDVLYRKLEALQKNKGMVAFFITGIPGTGKTELAKKYALAHKDEYSFIRIFDADSSESLQSSFEVLASAINSEEFSVIKSIHKGNNNALKKATFEFVLKNLKKAQEKEQKRWLWIFDNAGKYGEVGSYIPNIPDMRGTIIITTRAKCLNVIEKEKLDLNKGMDPDEAVGLLYDVIGAADSDKNMLGTEKEARNLMVDLNHLPLAVLTSAIYIRNENRERQPRFVNPITFVEYKNLLLEESKKIELEEQDMINFDQDIGIIYPHTQAAAIRLLIKQLSKEEQVILELCGFISANHIPRWLLNKYLKFKLPDAERFTRAKIKSIVDNHPFLSRESYGKGNANEDRFFTHRETSDQMRGFLIREKNYQNQRSKFYKEMIIKIVDFLKSKFLTWDAMFKPSKKSVQLMPHLRSLLDYSNKFFISEDYKKRILFMLRQIDKGLGRLKESCNMDWVIPARHDLAEKSCLLNTEAMEMIDDDSSSFGIAENLKNIGKIRFKQKLYAQTKDYFEQALSKLSNLSNNSVQVKKLRAEIYSYFARLYLLEKSPDKALEKIMEALEILEAKELFYKTKKLPIDEFAADIASYRKLYGTMLSKVGRYHEAINVGFREALYLSNSFIGVSICDTNVAMMSMNPWVSLDLVEMFLRVTDVNANKKLEVIEGLLTEFIPKKVTNSHSNMKLFYDYFPFYKVKARLLRIETRVKLGKLNDAYVDCQKIFGIANEIGDEIKECHCDYFLAYYHAAVIKYKQNDLKKSLEYFKSLFDKVGCRSPFNLSDYKDLGSKGTFNNKIEMNFIVDRCFRRSLGIFTSMYGGSHPLVSGYIKKHADKSTESVKMLFKMMLANNVFKNESVRARVQEFVNQ